MDDFKENKNYPLHMYFAENFTYVELNCLMKNNIYGFVEV